MIRRLLTFCALLLAGVQVRAATVGTGDFNTNQFIISGLSKVSLRNGAFVTNLTFNTFTIPGSGTNSTTYIFPLTNFLSGQLITVITNGNLVYFQGTNLPVSAVVFDTIEELVATPIPLPGIGLLAYVRDPLRGGPLAFYPNSVDTTNRFDTYASLDGPGNWKRPPDPNIRVEWGAVTGFAVTNDTLVAALVLQSARATGKVIYSGTDEFLHTDDVPLLDNNVLFNEDGAQFTGLVLSANGKTNVAVYGGTFHAPVADPSLATFYLTNTVNTIIQGATFVGYSGATKVEVTTAESKSWSFNSDGLTVDQGPKGSGALQTWQNGGTNKLRLLWDGTFDPAIGGGATINATDGYAPYRVNSTTFGDSPWYRISATRMGFNQTNTFVFKTADNLRIGPVIGSQTESEPSGLGNVGLGAGALWRVTTGGLNTGIGSGALNALTSGANNTVVGPTGASLTTGGQNTLMGVSVATPMTTGSGNSAFGWTALQAATTGLFNEAYGVESLNKLKSGNYNSGFGGATLFSNVAGIYNSAFGRSSGIFSTNTSYGTFVGAEADVLNHNKTNIAAFGWNAKTTNDNQMVFGTTLNTYDFPGATMTLNGQPVMTGSGGITGSGTAGNVPVWTAATTQGDSVMKISSIGDITGVNEVRATNFISAATIDAATFTTASGVWNATTFDPETRIRTGGNYFDLGGGYITNANQILAGSVTATNAVTAGSFVAGSTNVVGALSTKQEINFTAPFTGAVSRTVESKIQDGISVLDFGIRNDGVAITQANLDALSAYLALSTKPHARVLWPAGEYLMPSTYCITNLRGFSFIGDGASAVQPKTRIRRNGSGAGDRGCLSLTSCVDWTIEGIEFVVGGSGADQAVELKADDAPSLSCINGTFRNCEIRRFSGIAEFTYAALYMRNSIMINVVNCAFSTAAKAMRIGGVPGDEPSTFGDGSVNTSLIQGCNIFGDIERVNTLSLTYEENFFELKTDVSPTVPAVFTIAAPQRVRLDTLSGNFCAPASTDKTRTFYIQGTNTLSGGLTAFNNTIADVAIGFDLVTGVAEIFGNYSGQNVAGNTFINIQAGATKVATQNNNVAAVIAAGGSDVVDANTTKIQLRDDGQSNNRIANGTGPFTLEADTATTASLIDVLNIGLTSSATPAANFGPALVFKLEDDAGNQDVAARIYTRWTTATSGAETSKIGFSVKSAGGSVTERWVISGAGSLLGSSTGASTSKDTGMFIVEGGIGVEGAIFTGGVGAHQAGTSGVYAKVGGTLKVNTTTTGNVGAGEDDLITYSVTANTLATTGDYLEYDCWGTFAANANTARLKVFFGATALIDTTSLLFNGVAWRAHGKIIRTGAATQEATCEITVGGTLLSAVNSTITAQSNPAETLSGAVTFKVTGEDTGGVPANDKVIQKAMVLKWYPNN